MWLAKKRKKKMWKEDIDENTLATLRSPFCDAGEVGLNESDIN